MATEGEGGFDVFSNRGSRLRVDYDASVCTSTPKFSRFCFNDSLI